MTVESERAECGVRRARCSRWDGQRKRSQCTPAAVVELADAPVDDRAQGQMALRTAALAPRRCGVTRGELVANRARQLVQRVGQRHRGNELEGERQPIERLDER